MNGRRQRRSRVSPGENEDDETGEERFDIAFFITLGILALFFLIIFVPVIGPILILTIIPYIAGYQGGRYVNKKDGVLIAILVGFIWALVEAWIIFSLLGSLELAVNTPGLYTGLDWILVLLVILMNISFCTMGVLYSPRKFEKKKTVEDN